MYAIHIKENGFIRNISKYVNDAEISYNLNGGNESFIGTSELGLSDNIDLFHINGNTEILVTKRGKVIWRGRIDEVSLNNSNAQLRSYGLRQLLYDNGVQNEFFTVTNRNHLLDTTVNLTTDPVTIEDLEYYDVKKNEGFITLKKGAAIANASNNGFNVLVGDFATVGSGVILVDVEYRLPTGFTFYIQQRSGFNAGEANINSVLLSNTAFTGNGSVQRHVNTAVLDANASLIGFFIFNETGGTYTVTAETGYYYVTLHYYRIVRNTRTVSTTISASITAGTRTVTPGSMANINVGNAFLIGSIADPSLREIVYVTATTATTFTAVFQRSHAAGAAVYAEQITASEMIKRLVNTVNVYSSVDVQDSIVDIDHVDTQPTTVVAFLDNLCARGDGVLPFVWGVDENARFYTRRKDGVGTTYYADVDTFELTAKLSEIVNIVYGLYSNNEGIEHLTTYLLDETSFSEYGVRRAAIVSSDQVHYSAVEKEINAYLQDKKVLHSESLLTFSRFMTPTGSTITEDELRPGDKIIIRNIPAQFVGIFKEYYTIAQVKINLKTGRISYTFDQPLTTLEQLLRYNRIEYSTESITDKPALDTNPQYVQTSDTVLVNKKI